MRPRVFVSVPVTSGADGRNGLGARELGLNEQTNRSSNSEALGRMERRRRRRKRRITKYLSDSHQDEDSPWLLVRPFVLVLGYQSAALVELTWMHHIS
jgi:hypothetical protein